MSYQFSNVMSRFLGDSHQSKSIKSSSIVSASDSAVKQVNEKLMAPIHTLLQSMQTPKNQSYIMKKSI